MREFLLTGELMI